MVTAPAIIPCCYSTIVNSCFHPALFSVKVWALLCLGSHPAEESFISTGFCFVHRRRWCCFCWHWDLARMGPDAMLCAAGNAQKNNVKMLIRVMCNMGPCAVTPIASRSVCETVCGESDAGDIPCRRGYWGDCIHILLEPFPLCQANYLFDIKMFDCLA